MKFAEWPVLSEADAVAFGLDRPDMSSVKPMLLALGDEEHSYVLETGAMHLLTHAEDAADAARLVQASKSAGDDLDVVGLLAGGHGRSLAALEPREALFRKNGHQTIARVDVLQRETGRGGGRSGQSETRIGWSGVWRRVTVR